MYIQRNKQKYFTLHYCGKVKAEAASPGHKNLCKSVKSVGHKKLPQISHVAPALSTNKLCRFATYCLNKMYGDICIEDVVKSFSRGHSFAIARAQRCRREEQNSGTR